MAAKIKTSVRLRQENQSMVNAALESLDQSAPVFACNRLALEPAQRDAHDATTIQLLAVVQTIQERPTGYALELPLTTSRLIQAATFIAFERLCCPFLTFRLEVAAQTNSFWLDLAGPPGVKFFLQAALLPSSA